LAKLKSKRYFSYKGNVHDLSVRNTHSYNVAGVGVHNSAAGSLIAYALSITEVDPVKHGLIFSRFLNYGRAAVPLHFDKSMIKQVKDIKPQKQCAHNHKPKAKRKTYNHKLPTNLAQCLTISCCSKR
jgi:hypothetical protein